MNVPDPVTETLGRIINFQATGRPSSSMTGEIDRLVEFILAPKAPGKNYRADKGFDAPSAYFEFDVRTRLSKVLGFAFNPNIPSALSSPASIRWARWEPGPGGGPGMDLLAKASLPVSQPIVVRAVEQVENTPDTTSGAYHRYVSDRLLILYNQGGRNILVSVSKQREPSEVGKKGLIVGTDGDWNYLYSEDKGLSRAGLGWVRSRIFDSYSVSVYIENGDHMRCGIFQWMRAGWSGINMVRSRHLYDGLKRYAQAFSTVMENPRLPAAGTIEKICYKIRSLPADTLKSWFQNFVAQVEAQLDDHCSASKKWIAKHLKPPLFPKGPDDERVKDRLSLEWMKQVMGKAPVSILGPLARALEASG